MPNISKTQQELALQEEKSVFDFRVDCPFNIQ